MAAEDNKEAILRVCSYALEDALNPATSASLSSRDNIPWSLKEPFESPSFSDIGVLEKLPYELIAMILHFSDVRSFFRFRQLNRRARVISTAVPQYQVVAKYWPRGLRDILHTFSGQHVTMIQLYLTFTVDTCAYCPSFGGYLCLYTGWRCCYFCVLDLQVPWFEHEERKIDIFTIKNAFSDGYPKGPDRSLAVLHTLEETAVTQLPWLLFAFCKAGVWCPWDELPAEHFSKIPEIAKRPREKPRFISKAMVNSWYNVATSSAEYAVVCKGCQQADQRWESGVEKDQPPEHDCTLNFTASKFLDHHFKECEDAQMMWTESEAGTRPVDDEPRPRDDAILFSFSMRRISLPSLLNQVVPRIDSASDDSMT